MEITSNLPGSIDEAIGNLSATLTPTPMFAVTSGYRALSSKLSILTGISTQREAALKEAGVRDWRDVGHAFDLLPVARRHDVLSSIADSTRALNEADLAYFARRLPRPEYWRLAAAFPEKVLFLDIETTGLSKRYHQLTLIGWSRANRFEVVSADVGLPGLEALREAVSDQVILVTYNGSHFDIPFLRSALPDLEMPSVHIDLRHLGARVGLVGGQKKIELELGVARSRKISGLAGELAPALWFRYQRGDLDALRELVEYNHADVEGLKILLREMIGRLDEELAVDWERARFDRWLATDALAPNRVLEPFRGESRPRLQLTELRLPTDLTVVGIDLSGGPARPTGWAVLRGAEAETIPLRTDEEILQRTIGANPTIVSIDAPLSLPQGRTRVDDDDPGRSEFGITRLAERMLRQRGVNTYPALIRSMQGLTARGISLAGALRALGIPVIESFPGAMQDVLGMPRKGSSLPALKLSLLDYGITSDFLSKPVIHDEIDAVSSAIVGQAFWAGHYEALGNEAEDYLIVPDVEPHPRQRLITISGPVAAGKSTLAKMLEELGFARVRYSEVLAEELALEDRELLQIAGRDMHLAGGQRSLGQRVHLRVFGRPKAVVDGLRYPEDLALARERAGSGHIAVHIDATTEVREARWARRADGAGSFRVAEVDPGEAHLEELRKRATLIYDNSGSLYDLNKFATTLAEGKI